MRIARAFRGPAVFGRALLFLLLLINPAQADSTVCEHNGTRIAVGFDGAKLDACSWLAGNTFTLTFLPEDYPINHSPWYALRLDVASRRTVELYLHYDNFQHRYHPKISRDGKHWEALPPENQTLLFDGRAIKLSIPVEEQGLWLAGQELFTEAHYENWLNGLKARTDVMSNSIGKSREGRGIDSLFIGNQHDHYIALIGRQHPPEVTGAIGMVAFINRLLEHEPLADTFRRQWGILLLPLLNPDGVVRGHWRHNTGGIDLNRDWGPFSEPETRAARDELLRQRAAGKTLDIFLDFHSTIYDVFYTQLPESFANTSALDSKWLQRYESLMQEKKPGYKAKIQPGHNPDKPTSKAWVFDQFNIPAITVEYGDETDRDFIRSQARTAAESLMQTLIENKQAGAQ